MGWKVKDFDKEMMIMGRLEELLNTCQGHLCPVAIKVTITLYMSPNPIERSHKITVFSKFRKIFVQEKILKRNNLLFLSMIIDMLI